MLHSLPLSITSLIPFVPPLFTVYLIFFGFFLSFLFFLLYSILFVIFSVGKHITERALKKRKSPLKLAIPFLVMTETKWRENILNSKSELASRPIYTQSRKITTMDKPISASRCHTDLCTPVMINPNSKYYAFG